MACSVGADGTVYFVSQDIGVLAVRSSADETSGEKLSIEKVATWKDGGSLSGIAVDDATGDIYFTDLTAGKLLYANASASYAVSTAQEGAGYLYDVAVWPTGAERRWLRRTTMMTATTSMTVTARELSGCKSAHDCTRAGESDDPDDDPSAPTTTRGGDDDDRSGATTGVIWRRHHEGGSTSNESSGGDDDDRSGATTGVISDNDGGDDVGDDGADGGWLYVSAPAAGIIYRSQLSTAGRSWEPLLTGMPGVRGLAVRLDTQKLLFVVDGTLYEAPLHDPAGYAALATGFGELLHVAVQEFAASGSVFLTDANASAVYRLDSSGEGREVIGAHQYVRGICVPPSSADSSADVTSSTTSSLATTASPSASPTTASAASVVASPSALPSARPNHHPAQPTAPPAVGAAASGAPTRPGWTAPPDGHPSSALPLL